ncbi:MAG: pseudouridine-5'-phosphate glycosidase [Chloroflexi bacterium]|nr:pseudouridine-5'-phosphate glycosidase [Chloroflexota bacterium]
MPKSDLFRIHPKVAHALDTGEPVVALESTVIAHGLPYPQNVAIARELEAIVREEGATPATIALADGHVQVGIDDPLLERLALADDVAKVSLAHVGLVLARRQLGATTVAATMWAAARVGIPVFATGGTGGVHPGGVDISADLPALAAYPVTVVSAGVKSLLDIPATREWLETHGIPVLGLGTDELPGFYTRGTGVKVDARVDTVEEAAAIIQAHWRAGFRTGVLMTVPLAAEDALSPQELQSALAQAEAEAREQGIGGPALTPYVLAALARITQGRSVQANLQLLRQNARIAAQLAHYLRGAMITSGF